jgi:hypothetical protein
MRIGQAGNNRMFVEVDRARRVKFLGVFIGADKNDAIFANRDRFSARLFFVNGVNVSVDQQKIDILGCARR